MKTAFGIIVYVLAALMVIIIGITLYKNWMQRKRQNALKKESDYLRTHEKVMRQKGFKKFTFRVKKNGNKNVPRHVWAPDFKTANAMHQKDLRNGNI